MSENPGCGIGSKEAEVGRKGMTDGGPCVKLRIFNFREGHQIDGFKQMGM